MLLLDALATALTSSKTVGALAVVVDAIDDAAVRFYERYGFTSFQDTQSKLYLPIKTIESSLG